MRLSTLTLIALVAAAPAAAQTSAAPPPDPARLKLAQQIVEATGGQARIDEMLKSMFASVRGIAAQAAGPANADVAAAMQTDMEEEVLKLTPTLLQVTTEAYASQLTETELRDMLAWSSSPSGRSVAAKLPAIQQQTIVATAPMIRAALPRIMRKTMDRICNVRACTAEQRKSLEAAVDRMTAPRAG